LKSEVESWFFIFIERIFLLVALFYDGAAGITTNISCKICGVNFARGQKKNHFRSKKHQVALKEFKKKKKEETIYDELSYLVNNKGAPTLIQIPPEL
jgi:hypothetical protein